MPRRAPDCIHTTTGPSANNTLTMITETKPGRALALNVGDAEQEADAGVASSPYDPMPTVKDGPEISPAVTPVSRVYCVVSRATLTLAAVDRRADHISNVYYDS